MTFLTSTTAILQRALSFLDRLINPFIALGEIITRGLFKDAAILLIFFCIHYLILSLAPTSLWVSYYGLKIQSANHGVINVYSDRERRVATPIRFSDFLFCTDEDGEFRLISSQSSQGVVKSHPRKLIKWTYGAKVPTYQTQCQLRSEIFFTLDYGIERHVSSELPLFYFSP